MSGSPGREFSSKPYFLLIGRSCTLKATEMTKGGHDVIMTSSVKLPCNHVSWYLILCEPRKERYAANTLRHLLDLSTYLPEYKMYSHRETRSLPLFPGYIFVQANLEKVSPS